MGRKEVKRREKKRRGKGILVLAESSKLICQDAGTQLRLRVCALCFQLQPKLSTQLQQQYGPAVSEMQRLEACQEAHDPADAKDMAPDTGKPTKKSRNEDGSPTATEEDTKES